MATISGSGGDRGYDPDGNGLFEHLQLDLQLDVTRAGTFAIAADLRDASGALITQATLDPTLDRNAPLTTVTLTTGTHTLPLYFNGAAIRAASANGPYTVQVSLLGDQDPPLASASFTTAAYAASTFQGLLAELQSVSDRGVDSDTLPGYNLLRVTTQLSVLAAGQISVQGQLFAGSTHLGDATVSRQMNAGTQAVELDFPGAPIAAAGLDGPYTLYLTVHDANYTANSQYTTAAYAHSAFQTSNAYFTGSASDNGRDTNGNGRYEALDVTAQAAALAPGTYTAYGVLRDSAGSFIATAQATATLGNTPSAITLSFDGRAINRHGVDGPYQITLMLADAVGTQLTRLDYTTGTYTFANFEPVGAQFNRTFADQGIDTNADSYYDLLRVDVGVTVTTAGVYVVSASLNDSAGAFITGARQETYLDAGTQIVSLDFDGKAINYHGVNGPYHLLGLDLSQSGAGRLDSILEAYTTSAYAYTRFQPTGVLLTGTFADRGVDLNGNGLYDQLVVDMGVVIPQSDYYSFNARIVDSDGEEIVWASSTQYLTSGTSTISLQFDGRHIYGNGADGPYQVKDLSIYSGSQSATLTDVYTTGFYRWTAFEPAAVAAGVVTVNGQPFALANIYITSVDSDLTNSSGIYRFSALNSGTYVINIGAAPSLAPWRISVNGTEVAQGTSATIQLNVGQVTRVDFASGTAVPPTPTPTPPPPTSCELYPIALNSSTLNNARVGDTLANILNGTASGNFGWLTWTGHQSAEALGTSLTPPGDSATYVNPDDPADHIVSIGNWVIGQTGVSNSRAVVTALETLKSHIISVPVWDEATGEGANLRYHIVGFAQVQITNYRLPGQNQISATYRGIANCGR